MPAKSEGLDEFDKAAIALWETEYLVIVAGPSFYEPSDSTVFADELCDHTLLQTKTDKFFGFWGEFYNRYADRQAHEGYSILKKWRDMYFDVYSVDQRRKGGPPAAGKGEVEEDLLPRCYVVTAGVDGTFGRSGFPRDEIYEISGNINNWQCWLPCKPEMWSIDPSFRFDTDPVLREAKAIKWVDDKRPPFQPEVFTVIDDDDEPEDAELPPIGQDSNKGTGTDKQQKAQREKDASAALLARLYRATTIPLFPETQEVLPDATEFQDHFTLTPTSSHMLPETYSFPKEEGTESDEEEEPDARPITGPLQPYILKPRINHYLAHVMGMYYGKFSFHQGTFEATNPVQEKTKRQAKWTKTQRFFDSMPPPDIKNKRKVCAFYNISVVIMDASNPVDIPSLGLNQSQMELLDTSDTNSNEDDEQSLPPLAQSMGSRGPSPFVRTPEPHVPEPVFAHPGHIIHQTSPRSPSNYALAAPASPTQPPAEPSSPSSPSNQAPTPQPDPVYAPWEQGKDGRYYFSYIPTVKTHINPEDVLYDTIRVDFPPVNEGETAPQNLPLRGKMSVIAECCELPEPVKPPPEANKKDKKKKEPEPVAADIKLDPILEPTTYSATQLIGRLGFSRRKDAFLSANATATGTKPTGSTSTFKSNSEDKAKAAPVAEDFEYTIGTKKDHIFKIGVNPLHPRTIKYIEIEVPVVDAEDRSPLKHSLRHKQVTTTADLFAAAREKKKKKKQRPVPNHQRCVTCGEFSRPNIVMDPKKDIRVINPPKKPYQTWETAMCKRLRGAAGGLVILEMGCEKKPDASRKVSEKLYKTAKSSGNCTHIRLSTEDLEKKAKGGQGDGDKVICIVGPVLNSLVGIDRRMQDMKRRK